MKRTHVLGLLALLLVVCLAAALLPAVLASGSSTYTFAVLSTTDMHGRSTLRDVATQQEDVNNMARAATIIKNQEAKYGADNVLLIDNGDTIQGNLVAQYAINQETSAKNPMIAAMETMGYDVWVMGNHEFNFDPTQRDTQVKYAADAGIRTLAANIVLVESGKNIHGQMVQAGEPFYAPYEIFTLDAGSGRSVRVAVIGLGNAANATWDIASNYPNLQFSSLDNPEGLLSREINHWADQIAREDLADIIVVAAHSGRGAEAASNNGGSLESQAYACVGETTNMDLLIYGHDHTFNIETVKNAHDREIYIVNAGGSAVITNEFTVTFNKDGSVASFTVTAESTMLADAEPDQTIGEMNETWYEKTYAWASAPLGTFDGGWDDLTTETQGKTNIQMVLGQSSLMDFIHKGQIWSTWQSFETEGIEGATVSIASAVFAEDSWGGPISFVPTDGTTISTLELSRLYRYSNNLMCCIDMTGQQLYNWMSAVADMYAVNEGGQPALADGASIYGLDTFYGVDYTFDLTKPLGQRVEYARYDGTDLLELEGTVRVALNSYRLSGGYGFYEATGLTEADCCWTASKYLGTDRSPVPTQLGEYVAHMGTVTPHDPVAYGNDSTWFLRTQRNPLPFTDVAEKDWYYEAVCFAYDSGMMNGMGGGIFQPDGRTTRAQIATLTHRLCGNVALPDILTEPFVDVRETDWFYPGVVFAYNSDIIRGKTETIFAPNASASRQDMITMLYRMVVSAELKAETKGDLRQFVDGNQVAPYAREAMSWAVGEGLIVGFVNEGGKMELQPGGTTSRAQLATIIMRFMDLEFEVAP